MKKLGMGIAAVALVLGMASPAAADHDYGGYGYGDDYGYDDGYRYDDRDGRECRGGGCGNERDEDYGDGSCKYVCPAFDDSPVTDSFNVCLPGATCYWDGDRNGDRNRDGRGNDGDGSGRPQ